MSGGWDWKSVWQTDVWLGHRSPLVKLICLWKREEMRVIFSVVTRFAFTLQNANDGKPKKPCSWNCGLWCLSSWTFSSSVECEGNVPAQHTQSSEVQWCHAHTLFHRAWHLRVTCTYPVRFCFTKLTLGMRGETFTNTPSSNTEHSYHWGYKRHFKWQLCHLVFILPTQLQWPCPEPRWPQVVYSPLLTV